MIQILLTDIQMLDLFLRFAAVGQMLLLIVLVWYLGPTLCKTSLCLLLLCSIAYLLLTAPVANVHYGWLRPPLLLLTDLSSYALLVVYWATVHHRSLHGNLPLWSKFLLGLWFIWLGYFFLVEQGKGVFHDIHHGILLSLLVYIVIDAFSGLKDDLVERRRRVRLSVIAAGSLYMALLTLVELVLLSLKDHWIFSVANAAMFFIVCLIISGYSISGLRRSQQDATAAPQPGNQQQRPTMKQSAVVTRLKDKMETGLYAINGLSIKQLATEVDVPEHQLRRVINVELGFDNFSHFLNSYRISAVCKKLADPRNQQQPVLTLAFEAGFNSIAPFNRAFKQVTGITPSKYRNQF